MTAAVIVGWLWGGCGDVTWLSCGGRVAARLRVSWTALATPAAAHSGLWAFGRPAAATRRLTTPARIQRLVTRRMGLQHQRLKKPGAVRQMPFGGTGIGHRLQRLVFGAQTRCQLLRVLAHHGVSGLPTRPGRHGRACQGARWVVSGPSGCRGCALGGRGQDRHGHQHASRWGWAQGAVGRQYPNLWKTPCQARIAAPAGRARCALFAWRRHNCSHLQPGQHICGFMAALCAPTTTDKLCCCRRSVAIKPKGAA